MIELQNTTKNPRRILGNLGNILGTSLKTLVVSLGFLWSFTSSTDVPVEYHQELGCLQELLFYEARGTGTKGMTAVATVVKNRTNLKGFPSTYCGVSRQRFQFSFHGDKHNQKVNLSPYSLDTAAFVLAGTTARDTLEERLVPPFNAAVEDHVLYYHAPAVKPSWAKRLKKVYQDQYHVFYKKP